MVAPAVVVLALTASPEPAALESQDPAQPQFVGQDMVTLDGRQPVTLQLDWSDDVEVLSAGGTGTVTAVNVSPGDRLTTGRTVAERDGTPVRVVADGFPLYRTIRVGSRGDDVLALSRLLIETGYLEEQDLDDVVGPVMSSAIAAVNRDDGVSGSEFEPDRTVYAEPDVTVSSLDITIGSQWPPSGQPIATGQADLIRADVTAPDAETALPDLSLNFVATITGDTDATRLEVSPDGGLTDDALAQLREHAVDSTAETVAAVIALQQPLDAVALPVTSIITGPESSCVYVEAANDRLIPVAVEPLASELGSSIVAPIDAPGRVLVNPAQILDEPACT